MRAWLLIFGWLFCYQTIFANGFPEKYDTAKAKGTTITTVTHVNYKTQNKRKPIAQDLYNKYSAVLFPGSLKYNVMRIASRYGWHTVVWNAPEDYLWVGQARVSANSLQGIFNQIFYNYPLQAQFYLGNHVLAIVPRNLL